MTVDGGGNRLRWHDLPAGLRATVEARFGAVVDEVSMPGGFSPGMASVLRLAGGDAVFVKAIDAGRLPESGALHRREITVATALPVQVPAPRLLWHHDDGAWVALGFEHVPGRPPDASDPAELGAVLAATAALGLALDPSPIRLAPIEEAFAETLDGWRTLAGAEPPATLGELDPALPAAVDRLAAVEAGWNDAATGPALLHGDLRPDNMLLTPDGSVMVVDWPSACIGAPWVDLVLMLPSLALRGVVSQPVVDTHPLTAGVASERIDTIVVAMTGYFVSRSLRPPPPGLPTLRAFQRAQGKAALSWLRERCPDLVH